MTKRTPIFNVRTTQMTDEMYKHVENRLEHFETFREYAFYLIEKEMEQSNKDLHLHDVVLKLQAEMQKGFKDLSKQIDEKTVSISSADTQHLTFNEADEVKEGISEEVNVEVTGELDEDIDSSDF